MWRNYLIVAMRVLSRNKTYSFINIAGLAIGLAACVMILIYVQYERSYDSWLQDAENVYQLQTHVAPGEDGEPANMQMAAYPAGQALREDFPQVERLVYILSEPQTVVRDGEALDVSHSVMVDGPLFDVLRLPLVRGDPGTALQSPGSAVLSESEARRLFGDVDPVGRTLITMRRGEPVPTRVTAVLKDLPRNSHLRFNMIVRLDPVSHFAAMPGFTTDWGQQAGWVYARLRPGTDAEAIHAAMPAWERRNIPDVDVGGQTENAGEWQDYRLVNVRDVHLGGAQNGAMTPGNDRRTIVTFAIVAALILGMGCFNFTNLTTARASRRAREVALRKVLGARRGQLVLQFLGESLLLAAIAMTIALALVELLLPLFSRFLDADLSLHYFGGGGLLPAIAGLVLAVGAVGGLYPAFHLSRFRPASVLKANASTTEAPGTGRLRSALVVAQFAVSIGLIVCTAIVYMQTDYARSADPGYSREGLLQVENIGQSLSGRQTEALAREVRAIDGIRSVGRTNIGIATPNTWNVRVQIAGRDEPEYIGNYAVDTGFFATMGIRLLAGRNFDPARPADDATLPVPAEPEAERAMASRGINVVVNESAARRLGFRDPAAAVGRQFRAGMSAEEYGLTPITIIGVVQDSRLRSIRQPIDPIMFRFNANRFDQMLVRYEGNPQRIRTQVHRIWRRMAPETPFVANFSEEIVADLYDAEQSRAQIFGTFASLAVVIACLGLFGLAAFTAERRTKEIGIRKVFGARTRDIVRLLAWQFSKPVILANLIAWPVAWWVMRDWLNGFDARIDLGPGPFLIAGLLALAIAIGTIAGHALKVSRTNPIHALRYE